MKKKYLFLIICFCLLLIGCGKKKKEIDVQNEEIDEPEQISLTLGDEELTFKEETKTCGDKQIQSHVVFSNENDENGYKGSYELYDCEDNNAILKSANGSYNQSGNEVVFTDSYGEELTFEITGNDTIELKDSNKTYTFTK